MKKSLLLKLLDWFNENLTSNVIGWIYATNAIISFTASAFLWRMQVDGFGTAFGCGLFFLFVAILFWMPEEWK